MKIALLGATGKTGRYLLTRLLDGGHAVTAIGRDRHRLDALDPRATCIVADLERPETVPTALADTDCVVSLAHARFAGVILEALPDSCRRLVLTGSTRKFTRLPDPAADAVREAEAIFAESGRPGVMLHPSMIYGAPGDRNVNRIIRYVRRWPAWCPAIVPLPGGGIQRLQPIFVNDVVSAMTAAVADDRAPGPPIILAGPEPITYANFVHACGRAIGRRVLILPIPVVLLAGVARLAARLRIPVPFGEAELRRAIEDKAHDITDMRERLGVTPRPFEEGLRLKIERGWF